jgi:hypothetical protein
MTDKERPFINPSDRAEYYRQRADECRTIADGAASVFTRVDLGQLADLYEDLASQIETRWGRFGWPSQTSQRHL